MSNMRAPRSAIAAGAWLFGGIAGNQQGGGEMTENGKPRTPGDVMWELRTLILKGRLLANKRRAAWAAEAANGAEVDRLAATLAPLLGGDGLRRWELDHGEYLEVLDGGDGSVSVELIEAAPFYAAEWPTDEAPPESVESVDSLPPRVAEAVTVLDDDDDDLDVTAALMEGAMGGIHGAGEGR